MKLIKKCFLFFKKCPLFFVLIITGILFTSVSLWGMGTIYRSQEYNPWKAPILSVAFTGLKEEIYPWQLWSTPSDSAENKIPKESADTETLPETDGPKWGEDQGILPPSYQSPTPVITPTPVATATPAAAAPTATVTPAPSPTPYVRPTPLRASTPNEYANHISADIYGDIGVLHAASYDFIEVDESYFDDALFIGDSRTVGLHDYTDLSEHGTFLCETALTIHKVLKHDFKGHGTVEEILAANDYGKIYLMVGINELGTGTTEDFLKKYTEVVDTLHELEPDAKIFIQANMRVTDKLHAKDAIFNNNNINARNNAIATLADNVNIFYIDVNEVICNEQGNLSEEYTYDQIHLLGVYNDLWKQFLMTRGVT